MTELIIALDVPGADEAKRWVERLGDEAKWYKIGLELFTSEGASVVNILKNSGKNIFLDLKFHDIPRTAGRAVARAADLGVHMLNIHTGGGRAMMEAAATELVNMKNPPKLLGVTVLTSMDADALREVGIRRSARGWVRELAMLAQDCGLDGVVASPKEIKAIRVDCGPSFLIVTPGIRSSTDEAGDQKRTATARQAKAWGADFVVVGRPILGAADPVNSMKNILKELNK